MILFIKVVVLFLGLWLLLSAGALTAGAHFVDFEVLSILNRFEILLIFGVNLVFALTGCLVLICTVTLFSQKGLIRDSWLSYLILLLLVSTQSIFGLLVSSLDTSVVGVSVRPMLLGDKCEVNLNKHWDDTEDDVELWSHKVVLRLVQKCSHVELGTE